MNRKFLAAAIEFLTVLIILAWVALVLATAGCAPVQNKRSPAANIDGFEMSGKMVCILSPRVSSYNLEFIRLANGRKILEQIRVNKQKIIEQMRLDHLAKVQEQIRKQQETMNNMAN